MVSQLSSVGGLKPVSVIPYATQNMLQGINIRYNPSRIWTTLLTQLYPVLQQGTGQESQTDCSLAVCYVATGTPGQSLKQ